MKWTLLSTSLTHKTSGRCCAHTSHTLRLYVKTHTQDYENPVPKKSAFTTVRYSIDFEPVHSGISCPELLLPFFPFCSLWSCRWKTACSPTPAFSSRPSSWMVFRQWHAPLRHMREKFWPNAHMTNPRPRINVNVWYSLAKWSQAMQMINLAFFILNTCIQF